VHGALKELELESGLASQRPFLLRRPKENWLANRFGGFRMEQSRYAIAVPLAPPAFVSQNCCRPQRSTKPS
jgi:hypothetical protein